MDIVISKYVIDVFSKFARIVPLKSKTGPALVDAFKFSGPYDYMTATGTSRDWNERPVDAGVSCLNLALRSYCRTALDVDCSLNINSKCLSLKKQLLWLIGVM